MNDDCDEHRMNVQRRNSGSARGLFAVFGGLMGLLVLTVVVDQFQWGIFNSVAAYSISVAKAGLILAFFMHLHGSPRLVKLAAATGVLWLGMATTLVMTDQLSRGWETLPAESDRPGGWPENLDRYGMNGQIERGPVRTGDPPLHRTWPTE